MEFYAFCIFIMLMDPVEQKEVPTTRFKGC